MFPLATCAFSRAAPRCGGSLVWKKRQVYDQCVNQTVGARIGVRRTSTTNHNTHRTLRTCSALRDNETPRSRFTKMLEETKKVLRKKVTAVDLSTPAPKTELYADFRNPQELDTWLCRSDRVIGGESDAQLEFNTDGYTTFQGVLSTKAPADKALVRSGYCYLQSKTKTPTLFGESFTDLSIHNGFELEIRGDGRVYMLNIRTDGMQREDLFQCGIYTRGGPLWQTIQIPFCDFLLTSLGYLQNEQSPVDTTTIRSIGIGLADELDGEFKLDIKSIKAVTLRDDVSDMDVEP
eukprot:m.263682 g.263682  ORF g.263682 m.263682 type:complete len:292 (-) comp51583_c0_seq1:30-905(-)